MTILRENWSEGREWQRGRERQAKHVHRPLARGGARVFPSIIISANDKALVVRAEVPGMTLEAFDITVSGDTLTVQGVRSTSAGLEGGWYHRRERQIGRFSRAIRLPAEVDGERAEATYVSGVLTIMLPLRSPAKPREIPVKVVEN